jgi:hypothetical protein
MKPRYPDRYSILYGGSEIRAAAGLNQGNGDRLLAKCPLWVSALQVDAPWAAEEDLANLHALAV